MKKIRIYNLISLLIILSVAISAYFFNSMLPDEVITHWDINGQADGWGAKSTLVVFIPFLIIGLYILFRFLPKMDPKKENYIKFDTAYNAFRLLIVAFLAAVFLADFFTTFFAATFFAGFLEEDPAEGLVAVFFVSFLVAFFVGTFLELPFRLGSTVFCSVLTEASGFLFSGFKPFSTGLRLLCFGLESPF